MHSEGEKEGTASIEAFDRAVNEAISNEVDLLNLSAGDTWHLPPQFNPYSIVIESALSAGVSVIAAAGNKEPDSSYEPVNCPAAYSEVIAVAGMVTECPYSPEDYDYKPEEKTKGPFIGANNSVPNCSYRECLEESSCIINQVERPWQGNPDPLNEKPDILAPVSYAAENSDGKIDLYAGTSYAAPVISGALGIVLGELAGVGSTFPNPREVRRELIHQSDEIDRGDRPKANITRLIKSLS